MGSALNGFLILYFGSSLLSAAANDFLVPRGGEVTADNLGVVYELQTAVNDNIKIVADPFNYERKSLQMTLQEEHAKVANGFRTEVIPKHDYVQSGVRWYAFSFLIPNGWKESSAPFVLAQVHAAQKNTALPPPLSIVLRNKQLNLALHRTNFDVYVSGAAMSVNDLNVITVPMGALRLNTWECVVVRANWSSVANTGSLDVWSTMSHLYSEKDVHNTYPSHLGNYAKIGIYAPWKVDASVRTVYSDFVWLGNDNASYELMYQKTPCAFAGSPPMPPEIIYTEDNK